MLLNYSLEDNFCEQAKEELIEDDVWYFGYDYQVDVSHEDVQEFFMTQNAKLDKETIKYLDENGYFSGLEEEDDRFYDFMLNKYKEQAYKKYRQEFEESQK